MVQIECKECGKIFSYTKMSTCRSQLKRHIHEEHRMSLEEYIVKYEYNGIHPKCPCGCGNDLKLKKGKWYFNKYYSDTCYGSLVKKCNDEVMKHYKETHMRTFDIVDYYEQRYDRKTFENAFELFKTKEISLIDISKNYQIDRRTLKKVWLALKITTVDEIQEILNYTKYKLSTKHNRKTTVENENLMSWSYNLIKLYPGKYTVNSLIKEYNKSHKHDIQEIRRDVLYNALYKTYGDEIDMYLAYGLHSSEEYQFFQILKFYIPNVVIKLGKKFILKNSYICYDIIIGNKILIEYDSDGYFHNQKDELDQDERKTKFAIDNQYIFLRLTKEDIKNIETILKIKNIIENEINRN